MVRLFAKVSEEETVAGLKIGGRTVASGELKLTRATKS